MVHSRRVACTCRRAAGSRTLHGVTNRRPSGLIKGDRHEFTVHAPHPEGSVSGAPNLPPGFTDTFTSRYIDTGKLRLHAARGFEVIAVDQRGIVLSDKPQDGYDTGTLAGDLVALMDALGHERFAVVGHDTGFAISYALAADHPDRVDLHTPADAAAVR